MKRQVVPVFDLPHGRYGFDGILLGVARITGVAVNLASSNALQASTC